MQTLNNIFTIDLQFRISYAKDTILSNFKHIQILIKFALFVHSKVSLIKSIGSYKYISIYIQISCIVEQIGNKWNLQFKNDERVRICVKPSSHNQKIVSFNSQFCLSSATTNNSMQISNREATSLWIQFYAWGRPIYWRWYCLKFPEFVSCHSIYGT